MPCPARGGADASRAGVIDPDVFDWEQDVFFESSWVCLGRSSDLPATGDHKAVRVGSETCCWSGTATRSTRSSTCAGTAATSFSSRHVLERPGHQVPLPRVGLRSRWPPEGELPATARSPFRARRHSRLAPLRTQEWNGWVFVNASGDAPDFSDHCGSLDSLTKHHESARLAAVARHRLRGGGKLEDRPENYHECYHCPQIHPELCRVTSPDSGTDDASDGAWAGGSMDLFDHAVTMSITGESAGKILRGLDASQSRKVAYYYSLWPNLLISLHPDYVMTHRLEPLAPDRRASSASGCSLRRLRSKASILPTQSNSAAVPGRLPVLLHRVLLGASPRDDRGTSSSNRSRSDAVLAPGSLGIPAC